MFSVCLLLSLSARAFAASTPIRFAGQNAELVLSEVSERTVRIELFPIDEQGRPRPPAPSTVLVPFASREKLRARQLTSPKELRVGQLRVTVKTQPLTVSVRRRGGKAVQELTFDEPAATNAAVTFHTGAPVLGLGEGAQQFDRRGALYPMEPSWGGWNRPVLGSVVPSPFVIGTDGWALFAHRPEGQFDLREGKARFVPNQDADGKASLDLFLINVQEPVDALTEYNRMTGRPVLPPKFALGYFQSHRTLAGPEEPLEIARTFREKKLPCDALIYLGTGYCTNGWNTGHGSLAFNPNAFVPENILWLHDLDFKVILHVNRAPRNLFGTSIVPPERPKLTPNPSQEGNGGSERRRHVSLRDMPGSRIPFNRPSGTFSPSGGEGWDEGARSLASTGMPNPPEDFDSPRHIRNYWARHRDIFALGVDGWWPDDGDELPLEARLTRHRCYYEGPLQDRPNIRPWSLHRTGYAGSQRYGGWIWSGDIDSKWETLAAHVSIGLNHGLSLTPFWGSDTGGFYPTRELTGELYVRWFQFSTFCPSFRSHGRTWKLRLPWGWNTGEYGPIENNQNVDPSELRNAAVEPICRKYLELRYRLLPYNYTIAREACDTGLPMMRALWLHYPGDAEAVKLGNEYLWGRDLLVAPVVEKGAKTRRIYLPAGAWYDWWTGEKHEGNRWTERRVDLATLPLYARAGAIIPIDPVRQYTSEPVAEPTTLRVYPGANGMFTLYDDDGESLGYRDGSDANTVWLRFRWNDAARRLTIEPDKRMKNWPGGVRVFSVELAGSDAQPRRVEFRGKRVQLTL